MHRPALYIALAYVSGILVCRALSGENLLLFAGVSLICGVFGVILRGQYRSSTASLLAVLFAGLFSCSFIERAMKYSDLQLLFGAQPVRVEVHATILQPPQWEEIVDERGGICCKTSMLVRLIEVSLAQGWAPVRDRIRVSLVCNEPIPLERGDTVRLFGALRRIKRATNPGQFDGASFWHRRGVDYSISVVGDTCVSPLQPSAGFMRRVDRMRERLRRGLEQGNPESAERKIIMAMILGYRENMEQEIVRPFKLTNTMHILAISGLHVGFFYLMLRGICRMLSFPPRLTAAVSIPLIALYALLTGSAVPVVRASVMFSAFLSAPFLGRQRDAFNTLGTAAVVILTVNPLQLFDAGFQLSFVAVLAILLFAGRIADIFTRIWPCSPLPGQLLVSRWETIRWHLGRKLIALLSTSIAAWIGLAAFIAYTFHVVTLLGLLGNMVVIPAGFAIVCLGCAGALCSLCSLWLAGMLNVLNRGVVFLMLFAVRLIARIPWSWCYVDVSDHLRFISFCGIVAAVSIAILWRGSRWGRWIGLCAAAIFATVPFAFSGAIPLLTVTFLDVGQGDAAYVEFPDGENLLIDGGPETGVRAGETVLRPFLESQGCGAVDTVLLTHPHDDHLLGLLAVMENFTVRRLVLARWGSASEPYAKLIELAARKDIPLYYVARGDTLAYGEGVQISVLNPARILPGGEESEENNSSIVLMLRYGGVRILLCADIERETENELCRIWPDLRAQLVKVAHHGGMRSSSQEFLRMVLPQWAIVSVGGNNRFGHPAPQTLAALKVEGSEVLRTDLHGAVTARTDGRSITVSAERGE
ncbi:MAG: DNA internalization-related competence protein ComEC/Rec2 [Candidatus Aureabacteria bacterium]|nr:DNA internalization-related competence protein ComEC/Rec2 [Candidatus Auribacterota bacterium]